MILLEIILSIFCTFNAVAIAKPPKNKKMVGSAKATSASRLFTNPSNTDKIGTNSAVIVTFTASVNHKIATNANNAKPLLAAGSKGRTFNKTKKRITSARNTTAFLFKALDCESVIGVCCIYFFLYIFSIYFKKLAILA